VSGRAWGVSEEGVTCHHLPGLALVYLPLLPLSLLPACFLPKYPRPHQCLSLNYYPGLPTEAQQDEPASQTLLAQVQESLSSYWDTAKAAAQGLYEKTYLTSMDEKLRYPAPVGAASSSDTRCPQTQESWP
jgi:hypothetical protein